uniref:Peptidase S1 domain-containing protein n=1 Tax=Anopheles christyi TaxID=43041 RepID=A0A182KFV0_9DIPT
MYDGTQNRNESQRIFPDEVQFDLSHVLNKNCGSSPYGERFKPEDGRIFENPWMVLFRHPEEQESFCQGTVISERHVLTTAICTEAIVANETLITLGEYDRTVDPDCVLPDADCNVPPVIELLAQKIIAHPNFQNETYENDIALVTTNERITFIVQPICLPLTPIIPSLIHAPIIYNTLWTAEHKVPKQIQMRYIAPNKCQQRMQDLLLLQEGQICAQHAKPVEANFSAGSGSPLLIEFHARTFQVGILSIGIFPDKLHTEFTATINKDCGEMPYSVRERPIFGRVYENPWLVLLRHPEETLHFCHGTLISNRYVLTTANCGRNIVKNTDAVIHQQATEVVLGEHDLITDVDCVTTWNCSLHTTKRSIDRVVIHPNFTISFYENDIALLFMNASVHFDNSIRPICLPLVSIVDDTDEQQLTIYNTIWSKESIPRQIWMRNVPREMCQEQIRNLFVLTEGHICARIFGKLSVDMNGSAGSALQVDYHGRIFQYGMLSVGFPNETDKAPYVYIDITKYINWIHDSVSVSD